MPKSPKFNVFPNNVSIIQAPNFTQLNTPDNLLNRVQNNIKNSFNNVSMGPFISGNLIKYVDLVAGKDNLIQHGLGSTPDVFVICQLNANAVVWSPLTASLSPPSGNPASASSNSILINLWCSVNCTVSLWVS